MVKFTSVKTSKLADSGSRRQVFMSMGGTHWCFYGNDALSRGFPGGALVKNLPVNAGDGGDVGSIPESGVVV